MISQKKHGVGLLGFRTIRTVDQSKAKQERGGRIGTA